MRASVAIIAAFAAGAVVAGRLSAAEFFVAPDGNDANAGTSPASPFRSVGRAAAMLTPGDTCWLRGGVYREGVTLVRSGEKNRPITFAAYHGENVVLDGADLVDGPWTRADGQIWTTTVAGPVEAVFCDGRLMTEARWPNCTWSETWDPAKKWSQTDAGSKLGGIVSAAAAASGQDFSGGLVYIKLSKGNSCYTRPIFDHRAGSPALRWDATGLPSRIWREDGLPQRINVFGFAANRFFVVAAGALDAPEEWWYDADSHQLRFITPDGAAPARHEIEIKRRVAAFEGANVSDLCFRGLSFRGCNLRLAETRRIRVESCAFLYPATLRFFPDMDAFRDHYKTIWLQGDENVMAHCEVAWAFDAGITMEGNGNRIEDCVVHDVNLDGCHPGPGISLLGAPDDPRHPQGMPANAIEHCTIYDCGGVGIYAYGYGPVHIAYNHVFNGGRYCVDVSAIYIPTGGKMAGSVVDHNWTHAQHGIGLRVDQEGRGIVFHHNLVWDTLSGCKLEGFVLSAYNNTILADNREFPFMVVFDPGGRPADYAQWRLRNNVAFGFIDRISLKHEEELAHRPFIQPLARKPGAIDHDLVVPEGKAGDYFTDLAGEDFRPKLGGPLDHAGVAVRGITTVGDPHPSIGAFESGVAAWSAGADWLDHGQTVPAAPHAASELARALDPTRLRYIKINQPAVRQ